MAFFLLAFMICTSGVSWNQDASNRPGSQTYPGQLLQIELIADSAIADAKAEWPPSKTDELIARTAAALSVQCLLGGGCQGPSSLKVLPGLLNNSLTPPLPTPVVPIKVPAPYGG